MLWLALLNLAAATYFQAFQGIFGIVLGTERQLWVLFALDALALAAWECAAAQGVAWLQGRWAPRLLATATGAAATWLAVMSIFSRDYTPANFFIWLAWLAAAYFVYRRAVRDLYVLAGGALSVIVVAAAFLGKVMPMRDAGEFLFVGLAVIGMSAAAGWWLRHLAADEAA